MRIAFAESLASLAETSRRFLETAYAMRRAAAASTAAAAAAAATAAAAAAAAKSSPTSASRTGRQQVHIPFCLWVHLFVFVCICLWACLGIFVVVRVRPVFYPGRCKQRSIVCLATSRVLAWVWRSSLPQWPATCCERRNVLSLCFRRPLSVWTHGLSASALGGGGSRFLSFAAVLSCRHYYSSTVPACLPALEFDLIPRLFTIRS